MRVSLRKSFRRTRRAVPDCEEKLLDDRLGLFADEGRVGLESVEPVVAAETKLPLFLTSDSLTEGPGSALYSAETYELLHPA